MWSNVDFNHFAGMSELETKDAVYWLVMSLGNDSLQAAAADAQESRRVVPTPDRFNAARADYFPAGFEKTRPRQRTRSFISGRSRAAIIPPNETISYTLKVAPLDAPART